MAVGLVALACGLAGCLGTTKDNVRKDVSGATKRFSIEGEQLADAAAYKAAYDRDSANPDRVLALFMGALLLIEKDQKQGYYAAVYMCREADQWKKADSPTGVEPSRAASEGYRRVWEQPEAVRSYCGAGGPPSYTLNSSTGIKLEIKQVDQVASDLKKYFLETTGKDFASPVTLRDVGGRWVIDEWSSIQTGVRKK